LNFHPTRQARYELPEGTWHSLAGPAGVSPAGEEPRSGNDVTVPPSGGAIFGRLTSKGNADAD
jgi:hypothetical protein